MTDLPYNPEVKDSILEYAIKLRGKTLREICDANILEHNYSGKGNFGQILEKFYFFYDPNSDAEPDFPVAKLELKSTPLKQLRNQEYRAKERLVLNIINYLEIINQDFETSSFWKKNANLLLVIYLHRLGLDILDYVIKFVDEWNFPETDLEVIKRDWIFIQKKVADGKAHELSEGDTYYLGACTKGGKGGNPRQQPNSDILAKQRAYSLKQGYVNHIIASISHEEEGVYGKLISSAAIAKNKTIEDVVIEKFEPLIGKSDTELVEIFGLHHINPEIKDYHSKISKDIVKSVLDVPLDKKIDDFIEEFSKADISVKTVRIRNNNMPCEDTSLPAFEYLEVYNDPWRISKLKYQVERKYLFVFFKYNNEGLLKLDKVKFWNMSNSDIYEAKRIWVNLKKLISGGNIVNKIVFTKQGKPIRLTNFPQIKTNNIHIRPHGEDKNDTYPLPKPDKVTGQTEYTKHSFWFNKSYVRDEIYLK